MRQAELYKEAFESSQNGIIILNIKGRILYYNKKASSILHWGKKPGNAQKKITEFISPPDIKIFSDKILKVRKTGSRQYTINFTTGRNKYSPSLVSSKTIFNRKQTPAGYVITLSSAPEEKNLPGLITGESNAFKLLFRKNPNSMMIYDMENLDILEVNNAAEKMYGYTRSEFRKLKVSEIRPAEDIPGFLNHINTGGKTAYRKRHTRKDGTVMYVDVLCQPVNYRGKKATLIIVTDVTLREEITSALEKSEERYRKLFETSGLGIIYCDIHGKVLLINDTASADFNLMARNVQGEFIHEILPQQFGKTIINAIHLVVKTKQNLEHEEYVVVGDNPRTYLLKLQPLLSNRDKVYGIQIIFNDITKAKRNEILLRESETRFRRLFENITQIPVRGCDEQHRVLFWNKASEIVYGYTKEEAIGQYIEDLIIPQRISNDFYNALDDFIRKDIPIPSGEMALRRKDGSYIDMFSSYAIIENYDGKKELYCLDIDMSKRIEAERQVALQANILNAVGQAVIATDRGGNIMYINDAACKLYQWDKKEVLNKPIASVLLNDSIRKDAAQMVKRVYSGETWSGEFTAGRSDGKIFPCYGTNSPLYNSCNEFIGIIGISFDITDLKKKEQELKAAKEKAEEMNKIKTAFLTNMSHELRTPLMGILGYSEILHEELDHEIHKYIANAILFSGHRLLATLNAILDLSKIEANRMELNNVPVKINSAIKSVAKTFGGMASKKGLYLELSLEDKDFTSVIDKNLFIQVLENLIHNSLKFTEKGSINISVKKGKNTFTVKVADEGIGIPFEAQKLIFDEFRQVSEGYGRDFEGSGIGLTLTKKLVKLLNGEIFLESQPGEGSTFTVTFPLYAHGYNDEPDTKNNL